MHQGQQPSWHAAERSSPVSKSSARYRSARAVRGQAPHKETRRTVALKDTTETASEAVFASIGCKQHKDQWSLVPAIGIGLELDGRTVATSLRHEFIGTGR